MSSQQRTWQMGSGSTRQGANPSPQAHYKVNEAIPRRSQSFARHRELTSLRFSTRPQQPWGSMRQASNDARTSRQQSPCILPLRLNGSITRIRSYVALGVRPELYPACFGIWGTIHADDVTLRCWPCPKTAASLPPPATSSFASTLRASDHQTPRRTRNS